MADFDDYDGDYFEDYQEEEAVPRRRDTRIDEVMEVLMRELFERQAERVFYGRQIEVLLENEAQMERLTGTRQEGFFHWITDAGLRELRQAGTINSELWTLDPQGQVAIRFYWARTARYWTRKARRILKLVRAYSQTELTAALGPHGDKMFDAALPWFGFLPKGRKVRAWEGKEWTKSGHDLDRVWERDGIPYGAEVKNTLEYIDLEELEIKLGMCQGLGLTPLFIMRMAPKSYIDMVVRAGGYCLIFQYQFYPAGHEALARKVKEELGITVDCRKEVAEGTLIRFLKWHLRKHGLVQFRLSR